MELNNIELNGVEFVSVKQEMLKLIELNELQLAMVGGGIGNVDLG